MSKFKLHPDVVAIKRAAPKWARWLVVFGDGSASWQDVRGDGYWWLPADESTFKEQDIARQFPDEARHCAFDLKTGDVHIRAIHGQITTVPQSQWVAARKRKSRK